MADFEINVEVDANDVDIDIDISSNDIEFGYEAGEIEVGGTKNYLDLFNKPKISGVELKGNLHLSDVGGVGTEDYISLAELSRLFETL